MNISHGGSYRRQLMVILSGRRFGIISKLKLLGHYAKPAVLILISEQELIAANID